MLAKLAYTIDLSFNIPKSEQEIGFQAYQIFKNIINLIALSKDHLDIIYNPFKKYDNISSEVLISYRGKLNIYKQQIKDNFEDIKSSSLYAIDKLDYFKSDTHILELINAFKEAISSIEKQVVILLDVLDNYKSENFKLELLSSIESVKKECVETDKLIKDRIIQHLEENIINNDWATATSEKLQTKIQDKIPLITELFNERQKALEQMQSPNIQKNPQTLNPGNLQKVWYPTDMRNMPESGEL
jgi:hypothetical protein